MQLTRSQRALIRRRTRTAEAPDPSAGELNVVPFLDIVVNLIMFLLATTTSVLAISQVEAQLPAYGPPCRGERCPPAGLDLSVTLTARGIVVAGSSGTLAPGCGELAPGDPVSVPGRPGGYDFEALTACAAAVKDRYPHEREVVLSADPNVPYDDVVQAMDALRNDCDRLLFPEVLVSAGVR